MTVEHEITMRRDVLAQAVCKCGWTSRRYDVAKNARKEADRHIAEHGGRHVLRGAPYTTRGPVPGDGYEGPRDPYSGEHLEI